MSTCGKMEAPPGVVEGVGQERLGPSYFFISLVLGPLNSLVWFVFVSVRTNKRQHRLRTFLKVNGAWLLFFVSARTNNRHRHLRVLVVGFVTISYVTSHGVGVSSWMCVCVCVIVCRCGNFRICFWTGCSKTGLCRMYKDVPEPPHTACVDALLPCPVGFPSGWAPKLAKRPGMLSELNLGRP